MYFSDGSAAQYKNKKKVINIYHKQDLGLSAEWHFFTISHGNGLADGMRGWLQRQCLKRVYNNQIRRPYELFSYCSSNIHNITVFYVQEDEKLNYKKELAE
jgi:hypothetical protein